MKESMMIVLVVAAVSTVACGQKKESETAPKVVETAFQQKFPTAQKVKWEKENDTEWEAEFKLDGKEYSANFSSDGTWKETEHEIAKSDIPAAVQNTLNTEFPVYKIEESEISETADGTVYEFELEKGKSEMEVTIDASGKVLKKEVEEEHEEKD